MRTSYRIGTRNSPLALYQAQLVKRLILSHSPQLTLEIVPILTSGDQHVDRPLDEIGGKGVFIKELEYALLENTIDLAVHCLKDVTSHMPSSLSLSGFISADYVADILISNQPLDLQSPLKIGTSSQRRQALLKLLYPAISCHPIRGNIATRLSRLDSGELDGIVLSEASIRRLNIDRYSEFIFPIDSFTPAPGQGVLAIQTRSNDSATMAIVSPISDHEQSIISNFEYQLMRALSFNCTIPLGIHSTYKNDHLAVKICIAHSATSPCHYAQYSVPLDNQHLSIAHIQKDLRKWISN